MVNKEIRKGILVIWRKGVETLKLKLATISLF